eukprot:TRINITY_DN10121_c0_g3_i1.p1 TRINITY_DN10121_c0_g3~~TRINITY_DN10121_c0_g3_i1.p1  ORF type:complete len:732 (+),score=55.51 TRINITY_DN10121_c0_g3_i1:74-2269(+)
MPRSARRDGESPFQLRACRRAAPVVYCKELQNALCSFSSMCRNGPSGTCTRCSWRVDNASDRLTDEDMNQMLQPTGLDEVVNLDEFTTGKPSPEDIVHRGELCSPCDEGRFNVRKVRALLGLGPAPQISLESGVPKLDQKEFMRRPMEILGEHHVLEVTRHLMTRAAETRALGQNEPSWEQRQLDASHGQVDARIARHKRTIKHMQHLREDLRRSPANADEQTVDMLHLSDLETAFALANLSSKVTRRQAAFVVTMLKQLEEPSMMLSASISATVTSRMSGSRLQSDCGVVESFRLCDWRKACEHSIIPVTGLPIREGEDKEWTFIVQRALDEPWPWDVDGGMELFRGLFLGTTIKPLRMGPFEALSSLSGVHTLDSSIHHMGEIAPRGILESCKAKQRMCACCKYADVFSIARRDAKASNDHQFYFEDLRTALKAAIPSVQHIDWRSADSERAECVLEVTVVSASFEEHDAQEREKMALGSLKPRLRRTLGRLLAFTPAEWRERNATMQSKQAALNDTKSLVEAEGRKVRMRLDRSPWGPSEEEAHVGFHGRLWIWPEGEEPTVAIEDMQLSSLDVLYPAVYASRPPAEVLDSVKLCQCQETWRNGAWKLGLDQSTIDHLAAMVKKEAVDEDKPDLYGLFVYTLSLLWCLPERRFNQCHTGTQGGAPSAKQRKTWKEFRHLMEVLASNLGETAQGAEIAHTLLGKMPKATSRCLNPEGIDWNAAQDVLFS